MGVGEHLLLGVRVRHRLDHRVLEPLLCPLVLLDALCGIIDPRAGIVEIRVVAALFLVRLDRGDGILERHCAMRPLVVLYDKQLTDRMLDVVNVGLYRQLSALSRRHEEVMELADNFVDALVDLMHLLLLLRQARRRRRRPRLLSRRRLCHLLTWRRFVFGGRLGCAISRYRRLRSATDALRGAALCEQLARSSFRRRLEDHAGRAPGDATD